MDKSFLACSCMQISISIRIVAKLFLPQASYRPSSWSACGGHGVYPSLIPILLRVGCNAGSVLSPSGCAFCSKEELIHVERDRCQTRECSFSLVNFAAPLTQFSTSYESTASLHYRPELRGIYHFEAVSLYSPGNPCSILLAVT